jgi:3-oxoacyl-[acyl-carrier protein] reductase
MDLGIKGLSAIVCASSQGLGKGCAIALAREGVSLTINGRNPVRLEDAAAEIRRETGARVRTVPADVTTDIGRTAILDACPNPDILINNAGGPPPGDFRNADRDAWISAVDANMLAPIFLIRAVVDGMVTRGFGRIVNITTSGVKNPGAYPPLAISIGVRAGLTGFVGVLSRQVAHRNVTINGLLPGRFETERLRVAIAFAAGQAQRTHEEEADIALRTIPAARFGDPDEFGSVCAFLCSRHAGYLTGQNIVLDGGAFPGIV